jgi:hypothetical protein
MAHTDNHAKDSAANTLKNNIIDFPIQKRYNFLMEPTESDLSRMQQSANVMADMIDMAFDKAKNMSLTSRTKEVMQGLMDQSFKEINSPLFESRQELSEWFQKNMEHTEIQTRARFEKLRANNL